MYVHNSDHILDKNSVPLQQSYPSSVCVGGILTVGTNVSHTVDNGIPIPEVSPIQLNPMEKPVSLKGSKLTFTNRSFESLTYSEIPLLLKELSELRKSHFHSEVVLFAFVSSRKGRCSTILCLRKTSRASQSLRFLLFSMNTKHSSFR